MSEQKMREALECVIERFGPIESTLIFSKRMAIKKCREALAQPPATVVELPYTWTGCADADTALILIGRIDAPDDQLRLDQLEQLVLKMGNSIVNQQGKGHAEPT